MEGEKIVSEWGEEGNPKEMGGGREPQINGERKRTPKKWGEKRNSMKGIGEGKRKKGKGKGKKSPKSGRGKNRE